MNIPVKIGWELLVFLFVPSFIIIRAAILNPELKTIVFAFLFISFLAVCIFGIKYKIKGKRLVVSNGIFGKTKININEISKIEKTSNLLSSPAPSLFERIEIYYDDRSIVISPKYFEDYKCAMLEINPNIEIK